MREKEKFICKEKRLVTCSSNLLTFVPDDIFRRKKDNGRFLIVQFLFLTSTAIIHVPTVEIIRDTSVEFSV